MEKLIESKLFILFGMIIVLAAAIYLAIDYLYWPGKTVAPAIEEAVEEQEEAFDVQKGDNFIIKLDSNPTTGYSWQVQLDSTYLELTSSEYVPETAEEGVVGSGGEEIFTFLAITSGDTELIFYYARPWESVQPIETKRYIVNIGE